MIYIHEIQLSEKDNFSKDFNYVGKLWQKANDESLSEEEQQLWSERHFEAKYCLEQGLPIGYYAL